LAASSGGITAAGFRHLEEMRRRDLEPKYLKTVVRSPALVRARLRKGGPLKHMLTMVDVDIELRLLPEALTPLAFTACYPDDNDHFRSFEGRLVRNLFVGLNDDRSVGSPSSPQHGIHHALWRRVAERAEVLSADDVWPAGARAHLVDVWRGPEPGGSLSELAELAESTAGSFSPSRDTARDVAEAVQFARDHAKRYVFQNRWISEITGQPCFRLETGIGGKARLSSVTTAFHDNVRDGAVPAALWSSEYRRQCFFFRLDDYGGAVEFARSLGEDIVPKNGRKFQFTHWKQWVDIPLCDMDGLELERLSRTLIREVSVAFADRGRHPASREVIPLAISRRIFDAYHDLKGLLGVTAPDRDAQPGIADALARLLENVASGGANGEALSILPLSYFERGLERWHSRSVERPHVAPPPPARLAPKTSEQIAARKFRASMRGGFRLPRVF
jgi:hypothetical protein